MKATLRIPAPETECGYKDIEVDITEEELAKLDEPQKTSKLTGYERGDKDDPYFVDRCDGDVGSSTEDMVEYDNAYYNAANYYWSRELAANNARADKLMRQLRRFAVEHRTENINWNDDLTDKYYIEFNYGNGELEADGYSIFRAFGTIYFDSYESAESAIKAFHDELIWYFTEYRDSL